MKLTSALSITDRAFKLFMAAVLAASSLVVLASGQAFAATKTWTGAGGNNNFSTAANWSDNSVPVNGDVISLQPLMAGADYESIDLTNDLETVKFGGIILNRATTGNSKFYSINQITFQSGALITSSGSGDSRAYLSFWHDESDMPVTAEGDLTIGAGVNIYSGVYSVAGDLIINGTLRLGSGSSVSGATTINGSLLTHSNVDLNGIVTLGENTEGLVISGPSVTYDWNLLVRGKSSNILNQLAVGYCTAPPAGGASVPAPYPIYVTCQTYGDATYTFTGDVSLDSNLIVNTATKSVVKFQGNVSSASGKTISAYNGANGSLIVDGKTQEIKTLTTTYEGNQPSKYEAVGKNEIGILNGVRGEVYVQVGGILKGTGTTGTLSVSGTVSPGLSPGTLTVINYLSLSEGAVFEAEIQSLDAYDQIVVTDGNVYLGDATLRAIAYQGFELNQGDVFTIIDKQSDGAIDGTFKDLPEGATFAFGQGGVARISYVGGDGNDVTLTIVTVPTAPDTGFATLMAQPWLVLGVVAVAGLGLVGLGRKLQTKR